MSDPAAPSDPPSGPRSDLRSDLPLDGPAPVRPRRPARRFRALRSTLRWTLRGGVLLVALPLVFALIAGLSLFDRDVTAPSWVKHLVEQRAAQVLEGGSLSFGTITLNIGSDLHPQVRLTNTVLTDAAGTVIARIPEVVGQISPRGLLFRHELMVQKIRLTGAQIALRRDTDGTVAIAFDAGAGTIGRAPSFTALLDQSDQIFERPALEALEQVSAEGLIVNFDDARAGRSWTVDGGRLALDLRGGQTRLTGDVALLSGRDFVTTLTLSYLSPRGSREAAIRLDLADVDAADIATQSPALGWLAVLDARMSATLEASIDAAGDLGPLSAKLDIGEGAVQPTRQARPIRFDEAKATLSFDPAAGTLRFDQVAVHSDWGGFTATGHAYLRDEPGKWPGTMLGQFRFADIAVSPAGFYPAPELFNDASVDLRLRLDPFRLEVGQFTIASPTEIAQGRAEVSADDAGWSVSVDAASDQLTTDRLVALWPLSFREGTRRWFVDNLHAGTVTNAVFSARAAPGAPPVLAASFDYADADVTVMKTLPPIRGATGSAGFLRDAFALRVDQGQLAAPQGGQIDVAGSMFQITDTRYPNPPAVVDIAATGTITAALSLLDLPPFQVMTKAGQPVTLADGRARATAHITLPLMERAPRDRIRYSVDATLSDVRSAGIVPGKMVTGTGLTLTADDDHLRIQGPVQVGQVPMQVDWQRGQRTEDGGVSHLDATVEISQRFLDEFGIGLPRGTVSGQGRGTLALDLVPDKPPAFILSSQLEGVGLSLPPLGWSKGRGTPGTIEVAGVLGATPRIDRLSLDAAGLTATGAISVAAGGGLGSARFSRVRLGGWFDAPVELKGQGRNRPAAIVVRGGAMDLRRASFGAPGAGEGGPMSLALDRLQIAEGIVLTDFVGEFSAAGGFSGQFTARVNGGPAVRGTVVPQNGGTAVRLVGDNAGAIIAAAGLLDNANGGSFDLSLLPTGVEGNYDGTLAVSELRVKHAPALASLLDAISVVGLLQQLDGQGLSFSNVDAQFRISPDRITIASSSAVGAGLGISMDGVYTLASRNMDFQGVISPFYLINGIGSVLTRRGEGLIGFNYTLRGQPASPQVNVNPLSLLTPGMFREIFRRPPPDLGQ